MPILIKPSDFKYRYPKNIEDREKPKFRGKPDREPFDRDDIYDILPMMEAVMNELGRDDARTLNILEDIMNRDLPRFVSAREEVFDFLTGCMREILEGS
jgi:hypothetical protein